MFSTLLFIAAEFDPSRQNKETSMKLGLYRYAFYDAKNDDDEDVPPADYSPCKTCGYDHRLDAIEADRAHGKEVGERNAA
jgi:hypothetical protein